MRCEIRRKRQIKERHLETTTENGGDGTEGGPADPDGTAEEAVEGAESSTPRVLSTAAALGKRRCSPLSRSHWGVGGPRSGRTR